MLSSRRIILVLAPVILVGVCVGRWSIAQSGSRGNGSRTAPRQTTPGSDSRGTANTQSQSRGASGSRPTVDPFPSKMWDLLIAGRVRYDYWGPFPGRTADLTPGESPHGKFVKIFANKVAREQPDKLPNGSILIKENYGDDGRTLMAITIMYRSTGYYQAGGDWYWVKYRPDGSVDDMPTQEGAIAAAGAVNMCIECHQHAEGGDFAFINDRMAEAQ